MSPRSCSGGPKSGPRGPKTAPRAARSAPRGAQEQPGAHQKGPKRGPGRPRSAKRPFGRPPWPILASFWGALGFIFIFLAIEASFSKLARAPPDNRKHSSKSLVKRSCVGLAGVWGQKTQPRQGVHVFLRTRKTSLFTNPTCLPDVLFHTATLKNPRFLRGSVLSKPFFAHPWLPEARNHTKMLFEITCQKVLRDSCGTEAHKDHGSVAGFWGRMPHWR